MSMFAEEIVASLDRVIRHTIIEVELLNAGLQHQAEVETPFVRTGEALRHELVVLIDTALSTTCAERSRQGGAT